MIPAAPIIIDARCFRSRAAFVATVAAEIDAGRRVRLAPTSYRVIDIVRNGTALLARDASGKPIGTFPTVADAIEACEAFQRAAQAAEGGAA